MIWDTCTPDELTGQWQSLMQMVVYVCAFLGAMTIIGMIVEKSTPFFYKLMSLVLWTVWGYIAYTDIIKSNMQCFGG